MMKTSKELYNVIKVKDGIYHIGSTEGVFMDLFVGSRQALLWDTGYGFGDLRHTVEALTDKPLIVVNSHGHLDHACGNFQFSDCPVYMHSKDKKSYEYFNSESARRDNVERVKNTKDTLPSDFDEEHYIHAPIKPVCTIKEDEQFDLGGITLTVKEVPGHTAGSIGLIYEEERWFYAGDAMNPFVWLFLPDALSLSVYLKSLEKAKTFNCNKLCISHHPEPLDYTILDRFICCAKELDYASGIPFENTLFPQYKARICPLKGADQTLIGQPACPAIVISEDHLKEKKS